MKIGPDTRALVTGASRGIGRALARGLAYRGASVGLLARSQRELAELADELPGVHHPVPADVTDRRELERAVDSYRSDAGGPPDLLIINAGIAHYRPFAEQSYEEIDQMVGVNVSGSLYTARAVLPGMTERGSGQIVIISSGAGLRAFPSAAVYGATKAANRGFAEALRHELAPTGIGVTTVYPGEIETDLHTHERDRLPEWRNSDDELDPAELADQILAGVESDARSVYAPPLVRLLGANGIAPGLVDGLLRRIRGESAAPRR